MEQQLPSPSLPPKKTKESYQKKSKAAIAFSAIKTAFLILLSSFLVSFASHVIIAPNGFATGGVTGIAILVEKISNGKIPQSVSVFALNIPLIVAAFFIVKKRFALLSLANILLQTVWLVLLENLSITTIKFSESIFSALAGGILIGVAVGVAFKLGGSTGGTDIVAVLVQKKFPAPSIAWMIFAVNSVIIACNFFVYDNPDLSLRLLPIIQAATEQFVESRTNETLTNGFHSAIEFRVVTDKPEEMSLALITRLGRGVTGITVEGMYTKSEHKMLLCIVSRRQVAAFKALLKEVDPDSFAIMSNVSQVFGLGFFSGENG